MAIVNCLSVRGSTQVLSMHYNETGGWGWVNENMVWDPAALNEFLYLNLYFLTCFLVGGAGACHELTISPSAELI